MKRLLTPLLWLLPLCLFGQTLSPEVRRRIEQVETGLRPAVEIADRPLVRYTLTDRMRQVDVPAVSR